MGRRDIKGIASGLLGSFVSRNNDVGGFWAIGKLLAAMRDAGVTEVVVDLLAGSMTPDLAEFERMARQYCVHLELRMAGCGLTPGQIAKAEVRVVFDAGVAVARSASSLPGSPFQCSVHFTDDLGNEHVASHTGVARPHDTRRETQSTRVKKT
jgi:hypothetical protein